MTIADPMERPNAAQSQEVWIATRGSISVFSRLWRLRYREEIWTASLVLEGISLIGRGARTGQYMLSWLSELQG